MLGGIAAYKHDRVLFTRPELSIRGTQGHQASERPLTSQLPNQTRVELAEHLFEAGSHTFTSFAASTPHLLLLNRSSSAQVFDNISSRAETVENPAVGNSEPEGYLDEGARINLVEIVLYFL
jgi:hypothetical protein